MNSMKRLLGWAALTTTLIWSGAALADEKTEVELLQRLESRKSASGSSERRLEVRTNPPRRVSAARKTNAIKILERRLEIQDETAKTAVSSTPIVQAGSKGFSFRSPDGANQIRLRGVLQVDGRFMQVDAVRPAVALQVIVPAPSSKARLANFIDLHETPIHLHSTPRRRIWFAPSGEAERESLRAACTIGVELTAVLAVSFWISRRRSQRILDAFVLRAPTLGVADSSWTSSRRSGS